MDAVEARGVVKRYDEVEALRGVDLVVKQGETFGLLGPNGAGKSTLMQILSTMLRPTEGDAWLGGHSVTDDPESVRRQLGMVFQHPTLDVVMNAKENLWIHGRLYGVSKSELRERIPELISLVGLEDRADDPVMTYSGGMRRRLEIVRSIIHRPQILLLDEPTVALDPHSRSLIWDHILRLKKEMGMTILVTTHYLEEADALCDRVAIIDGGKIGALDSPTALKHALGGDSLTLTLDRPLNGASTTLAGLADVLSVTPDGASVHLLLRNPDQTIPSVLHAIAMSGARVTEMRHKPASLNDVFLQHTGRAARDGQKKPRRKQGFFSRLIGGA